MDKLNKFSQAINRVILIASSILRRKSFLVKTEILAQRLIQGVNIVKLVLYEVLVEDFAEKYKEEGEEFYKTLAASIVNEIFGCHKPKTEELFTKNEKIAIEEIRDLGTKHPELKRPITDALRVLFIADTMIDPGRQKDMDYHYHRAIDLSNKATERGIFIKGGDAPSPEPFLQMAEGLIKKYDLK